MTNQKNQTEEKEKSSGPDYTKMGALGGAVFAAVAAVMSSLNSGVTIDEVRTEMDRTAPYVMDKPLIRSQLEEARDSQQRLRQQIDSVEESQIRMKGQIERIDERLSSWTERIDDRMIRLDTSLEKILQKLESPDN